MTAYAVWSLACNDCDAHYPAQPNQVDTELAIVRAAVADGWERRKNTHRCPACIAKAIELGYRHARGICATCNAEHALNAAGNLRQHNKPATPGNRRWTGWCDGSRKAPLPVGTPSTGTEHPAASVSKQATHWAVTCRYCGLDRGEFAYDDAEKLAQRHDDDRQHWKPASEEPDHG